MPKFAVAYINQFNNFDLKLSFVEAADWREALVVSGYADDEVVASLNNLSYKDAQQEAFNQDWNFAVEEVNL